MVVTAAAVVVVGTVAVMLLPSTGCDCPLTVQ
jgi:hypothetical protein